MVFERVMASYGIRLTLFCLGFLNWRSYVHLVPKILDQQFDKFTSKITKWALDYGAHLRGHNRYEVSLWLAIKIEIEWPNRWG